MIVVGIDPGKTGGIAFLEKGKNCEGGLYKMPINVSKVDVGELQTIFLEHLSTGEEHQVYIEKQQVRARQRGGALIGENYGRIVAVLELLELTTIEVIPRVWKSTLFPDQVTAGNKEISIQKCINEGYDLPTLKPTGKKLHDGIADAICIALYGWKKLETS